MKITLMIILGSLIITMLNAQEKLNELSSPTSPASYILGIQPSSVLAPKTAQALESAVYSNFLNNKGETIIPNDFALEFTPYWAVNHGLTLEDYLFPKDVLMDQVIRNSSFSLASTQKFLLGDSTTTNSLAIGYRTTLFFGNSEDKENIVKFDSNMMNKATIINKIVSEAQSIAANQSIRDTDSFLKVISGKIQEIIIKVSTDVGLNSKDAQTLINNIVEKLKTLPKYEDDNDKFLDAFNLIVINTIEFKPLFEKFKNYLKQRQGWSIDVAYANLLNFPTNDLTFSFSPRQSIWITPTYRFSDGWNFLRVMGVLRYEWYNTDYYKKYFPNSKFYENNTDYGISVSADFEKFFLQFEAVGRSNKSEIDAGIDPNGHKLYIKDQSSDFQYIGTFGFHLSDNITLNYSLGNRFKPEINPNNIIVSTLSLNFGFGTPTEKESNLKLNDN